MEGLNSFNTDRSCLEKMINLNTARQIAGVSFPVFQKLVKSGAIKSHTIGQRKRFFPTELIQDLKQL